MKEKNITTKIFKILWGVPYLNVVFCEKPGW